MNTRYRSLLAALCLLAGCMCFTLTAKAQVRQPLHPSIANKLPFSFIKDTSANHTVLSKMPSGTSKQVKRPAGITATCNTSNFYMHLTAGAGKKINLQEIRTMTDGNFLLAGNVTLPNTEQEGLLCVLSNAGTVITQKQVRINNRPTTLLNIKTMFNGQVAMAGIVHENTDKVFTALLNSDLSINWLKMVEVTGPVSTALDVIADSMFYVAAQANNTVSYFVMNRTGLMVWNKQLNITGLDNLAGIGHNLFEQTLTVNCTIAGKKQVQLFTIEETTGNILNSTTLGDGTAENKAGRVTSFNARVITTGITKNNSGAFVLNRQIMYDAVETETLHTYSLAEPVDFTVSSAIDNAGDAMGFCFPASGKLLFLYHFAYYQIAPEHSVTYTVPPGSTLAGVTRSINDGGYLLALNTAASGESILVKTDSIGTLAGCNYQNIAVNYTENLLVANTPSNVTNTIPNPAVQTADVTENSAALAASFDCNQVYCPTPPTEDSCLSSYFKTFRSNSYVDAIYDYHLMQGNQQMMVTARYNRAVGDVNVLTYGIKLFDERGNFIKGVNVYSNGLSAPIFSKKVDDRHIMIIYYSQVDTIPSFTFTLMDNNLQVVWSRSIKTFKDYFFFGSGSTTYLTSDKEGNYYFFGTTPGYFEKVKTVTYKMDANGNPLWQKYYEIDANLVVTANATTTNTSLIMILEGGTAGSFSLRLDKATGQMLNAYNYQKNTSSTIYDHLVQFDEDRIYYTGDNKEGQLVIGTFDTTSRPIKLLSFDGGVSYTTSTAVKSGKLYGLYTYFSGPIYKNVLFKADSSLNLEYANEYDPFIADYNGNMAVSDEGNIYTAGNYSYGGANGAYFDPFLKKYDANGLLGTCNYNRVFPATSNIDLQTKAIAFKEIALTPFTPINVPLEFVEDTYGQQVAAILCSSTPTCKSVKLTGSNKVCKINQSFIYHAGRNTGCTNRATWLYDTAFAVLQNVDDTTAEINFKKTGSTWIKVRLNAGCSFFTDSMLVQVQQSPGVFSLGNDTALCPGTSLIINAGSGFNSYQWQDGSTDSVFNVTQPGIYFVSVDNVCGEVYKDTINVLRVNVPAFNIGRDTSICKGDTLRLSATAGFNEYVWQPSGTVIGQGTNVGIYTLQNIAVTAIASTVEGCKAYDTLVLSLTSARPVLLGNDTSFCTGDSLLLSAGTGYLQYTWSNGALSPGVNVKQAGVYTVTATDVNGCRAKDTIMVQLYILPSVSLGNDFNLCKGSQQQIDAGNFSEYLWQDGSTGRYYNTVATGRYWVTARDVNSCSASDTVLVKNILPLPADFLLPADSICQYEKVTLGTIGNFNSYLWSTGAVQPAITVDAPGLYTLTVKDAAGCSGTDSLSIFQKDCFAGVFIPTAFTPNKDNRNDVFKATVYGSLVTYRLEVFNRFGEMVFSTADPLKGWDGTFKGTALPSSSFVWQCSYQFGSKSTRFLKGNVTLLR